MRAGAAVVDAWAILALLQGEGQAAVTMRRYLRRARSGNLRLLVNVINLGEVYYRTLQRADESKANERLHWVRCVPIEVVPAKEALVLEAARLKADHPMSYADAFAVATARQHRAPLLTGDPEILALPRKVVQVRRLDR
jgi:ribonuclease VapC